MANGVAGFVHSLPDIGKVRHEVKVWDLAPGEELLKLDTFFDRHLGVILSFSPDGHRPIGSFPDPGEQMHRVVRTWDATPREEPQR